MTHSKQIVFTTLVLTSVFLSKSFISAQSNDAIPVIEIIQTLKSNSDTYQIHRDNQSIIVSTAPESFQSTLITIDGQRVPVLLNKAHFGKKDIGKVQYYTGKIVDVPSSFVTLKLDQQNITGVISSHFGNQRFASIKGQLIFEEDHLINKKWKCSSDQFYGDVYENKYKSLKSAQGDTISIYVECDFEMYQSFGSSMSAVTTYVNDLFHQFSSI